MPAKGISKALEQSDKTEWLIRHSDLSGGCGQWRRMEERNDLRSQTGYWFGRLDTFNPGCVHLPLIFNTATFPNETGTAESTTTTSLTDSDKGWTADQYIGKVVTCGGKTLTITSNTATVVAGTGGWSGGGSPTAGAYTITLTPSISTSAYAALCEHSASSAPYLYLAVGPDIWRTQGTTFAHMWSKTSGQGRRLEPRTFVGHVTSGGTFMIWAAGPDVNLQYTYDGVTWDDLEPAVGATIKARLAWTRLNTGGGGFHTAVIDENYELKQSAGVGWSHANWYLHPRGSVEPFIIHVTEYGGTGSIESQPYVANGSEIVKVLSGNTFTLVRYQPGLTDITAGCAYQDEMALVDSGCGIYLWGPERPLRPIPIWREDGCPTDLMGRVKAVTAVGDILIAFYELDATSNTLVFWGRRNIAGQWTWHCRSANLLGGHLLGNQPILMTRATPSTHDRRRLWVLTSDGSTFRAYYQDWPLQSWNPTTSAESWIQYEDGYKYLYTSWEDLQLMGDEAGALMDIEANRVTTAASKLITVHYRTDYDTATEENATWDPNTVLTHKDTRRRVNVRGGQGLQAESAQLRIGMDRDSTATNTPILRDLGTTVVRQVRHPSLRRK